MSKPSEDLLRDEIKTFSKIWVHEEKIKFINNRLISLDEKHFEHHMFFKKLQIILNDIPKIDYGIKINLLKVLQFLKKLTVLSITIILNMTPLVMLVMTIFILRMKDT